MSGEDLFDGSMEVFALLAIPLVVLSEESPSNTRRWAMIATLTIGVPWTAIFVIPFFIWMVFVVIPVTMVMDA